MSADDRLAAARQARELQPAAGGRAAAARPDGRAHLARGLAAALADPEQGRDDLRAALALFSAAGDDAGRLVAAAALVQTIGIADDDYAGFEAAASAVQGALPALDRVGDAGHRLLARTGALVVGWFRALDDPALAPEAEAIVHELGDATIAAPVRCVAGTTALAYFVARMSLEGVLWVELAMRDVLGDPELGVRPVQEWHLALEQGLYECGSHDRATQAGASIEAVGLLPATLCKRLLVQAQIAIGEGRIDDGRAALQRAEPLLHPRAPRPAGGWHLLQSRLELHDGRQHEALVHARLAMRLMVDSQFPERWMGVTLMQPGQVHMAAGEYAAAVPYFERAGQAASGTQADFCHCLAHFAGALARLDADGSDPAALTSLRDGFAMARQLHWIHFFRPAPRAAAALCAAALEHGIDVDFVREVIAARKLDATRPDLAIWPWPIRVRLLGRFRIEIDGAALSFTGKVAKKPLELLQFLVASGGSDVSVATIAFALWRELDGDKAKAAFNVALHRLRKLLGREEAIILEGGRLGLDPKQVWVDCLAFEQLVDGVLSAAPGRLGARAAADLQRALGLYEGPFLHEAEDEPWQLVCRSRLASKLKRGVERLAREAPAGVATGSLRPLLERALELEPAAEELARALMRLLGDGGEQAAALAVFERFRTASERALGARPAAATLALRDRILAMA